MILLHVLSPVGNEVQDMLLDNILVTADEGLILEGYGAFRYVETRH